MIHYAYDTLGQKVYLHPLSTEGEGLAQYPVKNPIVLPRFCHSLWSAELNSG